GTLLCQGQLDCAVSTQTLLNAYLRSAGNRKDRHRRQRGPCGADSESRAMRGIRQAGSDDPAPLDDAENDHHQRDNEEEVNQPPEGVSTDHSQGPHDDQDNDDCFQHWNHPLVQVVEDQTCRFAARSRAALMSAKILRAASRSGSTAGAPASGFASTIFSVSARTGCAALSISSSISIIS